MENSAKIKMAESSSLLGVGGILREACKIPLKNGRLTASITLLVLLPYLVLLLGFNLALEAVTKDLLSNAFLLSMEDPGSPAAKQTNAAIWKDARRLLGVEAVFALGFGIVLLFGLAITVYSSASSYVGKYLTPNDLFYRLKRAWIRLLITVVYIALISMGCLFVLGLFCFFASLLAQGKGLIALIIVLVLLASVLELYLANIWMLALVMSVVEDDLYGLAAIGEAGRLINGSKIQGMLLMLMLWFSVGATTITLFFIISMSKPGNLMRSFLNIGMMGLVCLLKLFSFVVYTVFYYECKKKHGEPVEVADPKGYIVLTSQV